FLRQPAVQSGHKLWSMVPLGLSSVALVLALLPARTPTTTLWVTAHALPAGATLVPSDLRALSAVVGSALPVGAVTRPPIGWHLLNPLPANAVVSASALTHRKSAAAPPLSQLEVSIPVSTLPPGLGPKAAVMLLLSGTPPQVLVPRAMVSSTSTTPQGSFVAVSLSQAQAELVEFAISSGKVVVLPWIP
ncbi:MAG: SAF domain-containing protein, partial [Sulfobacillus sp.]